MHGQVFVMNPKRHCSNYNENDAPVPVPEKKKKDF